MVNMCLICLIKAEWLIARQYFQAQRTLGRRRAELPGDAEQAGWALWR